MKDQWRRYLSARAPLHASYPSAARFDDQTTALDYAERLAGVGLYEPLSLYLHIPFCRQTCWHCGCNMRVERDYDQAMRYVRAICGEIQLVGMHLGGAGRPLSVHFGGGTPNILKVREIADILGVIELSLGLTDSTRLAIDLDPRLIAPGDVDELAGLGFNRMGLGVQDFDEAVQLAINRVQSFEMVESAVGDMRRAGVNDVAFDVICGLPKQTAGSFRKTIEKTIALSPDRVAVIGYAHLPEIQPRQRLIDEEALPDGPLRAELSLIADDLLIGAGYRRIGFDQYAKADNLLARAAQEGRLRRNFQRFTDDVADTTIGLGASAISYVGELYARNARTPADYCARIDRRKLATASGIILTPRDRAIAQAMRDVLCRSRAGLRPLLQALSPSEAREVSARLDRLDADGVIRWNAERIEIAEGARPLAQIVASALNPHRDLAGAAAQQPMAQAF